MCIAPDCTVNVFITTFYSHRPDLLVHKDVVDEFVKRIQETLKQFLGADPAKSPDYGRIVNGRHFKRVINLLKVRLLRVIVCPVCLSVRC